MFRRSLPLLLLGLLCGCEAPDASRSEVREAGSPAEQAAVQATDDASKQIRLDHPAERIVALIPSINEMLLAMGARDRLVARTDYDVAAELAELPSVGGGLTPSVEWLTAARPDLVVAWPDGASRSLGPQLQRVGIPVYAAKVETLEDAYRTTARLGDLLGMASEADSLIRSIRAAVERQRRRTAGLEPVRAAYLIGIDPPFTAAEGTSLAEVLRLAGGTNVFADAAIGQQQVSIEALLERDPDVLLVSVYGSGEDPAAILKRKPGWRDLRAVRTGRVHALDATRHSRPGPHTPETIREMAELLHPRIAGSERP